MNDERLDEMLMICPEWYNACYASVGDVGYFQEQLNLNLITLMLKLLIIFWCAQ